MKAKIHEVIVTAAVVTLISSALAQQRPAQPPRRQPTTAEQQAIEQGIGALFKAMQADPQQGGPVSLIDHRELKALLPAELKGFKRTSASSERSGAMGMWISRAEARYEGANDSSIQVEISDLGGLGGLGAMAQATWMMSDIDREAENGFERTVAYKNWKAREEYIKSNRQGKMEVLVGERIMVSVQGSNLKFEDIRAAMEQIDLAKLAALKPADPAK